MVVMIYVLLFVAVVHCPPATPSAILLYVFYPNYYNYLVHKLLINMGRYPLPIRLLTKTFILLNKVGTFQNGDNDYIYISRLFVRPLIIICF